MSRYIQIVETDAVSSSTATIETDVLNGLLTQIRVDVLTSGSASSNTATIALVDNIFERTIITLTGITGTKNFENIGAEFSDNTGSATGAYAPYHLQAQRVTINVSSATDGDTVKVFLKVL